MIQVMKPALEVVVDMVLGPPHNTASSSNPTGLTMCFFLFLLCVLSAEVRFRIGTRGE